MQHLSLLTYSQTSLTDSFLHWSSTHSIVGLYLLMLSSSDPYELHSCLFSEVELIALVVADGLYLVFCFSKGFSIWTLSVFLWTLILNILFEVQQKKVLWLFFFFQEDLSLRRIRNLMLWRLYWDFWSENWSLVVVWHDSVHLQIFSPPKCTDIWIGRVIYTL